MPRVDNLIEPPYPEWGSWEKAHEKAHFHARGAALDYTQRTFPHPLVAASGLFSRVFVECYAVAYACYYAEEANRG